MHHSLTFLQFSSKRSLSLSMNNCSSSWNSIDVGGNPVLPIAFAGGALEVPAWLLCERLDCVWWVQVSAVGELLTELSWINWFRSKVNLDICSFGGPKFALILSSIKSCEILLVGSSVRSGARVAWVSVVFSALPDILVCEIILYIFQLLRVLGSGETLLQLAREVETKLQL